MFSLYSVAEGFEEFVRFVMFKHFNHSSYREKETPYVEGYFESNHIFMNICHKIHLCANTCR